MSPSPRNQSSSNANGAPRGCPLCRPKVMLPLLVAWMGVLVVSELWSEGWSRPSRVSYCSSCRGIARAAEPAASPAEPVKAPARTEPASEENKKTNYQWRDLFDGKTLKGWKVPQFGGEGEVSVKDGAIVMEMGDPMTGIAWSGGALPKINYEVSLEARRVDGNDFFATTTFPVGKNHCSLVVGGWAGVVVGLSCIDYYDAGDNITTQFADFKKGQWYRVRIRVSETRIEAWIDKDKLVDLPTKGHKIDTRMEVDLCRPFGIASYITTGALRNIRVRQLKPEEVAKIASMKEE